MATPLDPELVAWASLILTMGPQHADSAEALGGHGKVWMLTAFSEGGEDTRGPGVPDPFGGDAEDYLDCFRELEGLVEAALGRVEADFLAPEKEAAQ
jgi:protein-tyrosine phosphatase